MDGRTKIDPPIRLLVEADIRMTQRVAYPWRPSNLLPQANQLEWIKKKTEKSRQLATGVSLLMQRMTAKPQIDRHQWIHRSLSKSQSRWM